MINKNKFSVKNTKKILHKIGKQWVVISAVVLGLIAGGAVVNASADSNQQQQPNTTMVDSNQKSSTTGHTNNLGVTPDYDSNKDVTENDSKNNNYSQSVKPMSLQQSLNQSKSSQGLNSNNSIIKHLINLLHTNVQGGQNPASAENAYTDLLNIVSPDSLSYMSKNALDANTWIGYFGRAQNDLVTIDTNDGKNGEVPDLNGIINKMSAISSKINTLSPFALMFIPHYSLGDLATRFDTPGGFAHGTLRSFIPDETKLDQISAVMRFVNNIPNSPTVNSDYSKVINDLSSLASENAAQQSSTLTNLSSDFTTFAKDVNANGDSFLNGSNDPGVEKALFDNVIEPSIDKTQQALAQEFAKVNANSSDQAHAQKVARHNAAMQRKQQNEQLRAQHRAARAAELVQHNKDVANHNQLKADAAQHAKNVATHNQMSADAAQHAKNVATHNQMSADAAQHTKNAANHAKLVAYQQAKAVESPASIANDSSTVATASASMNTFMSSANVKADSDITASMNAYLNEINNDNKAIAFGKIRHMDHDIAENDSNAAQNAHSVLAKAQALVGQANTSAENVKHQAQATTHTTTEPESDPNVVDKTGYNDYIPVNNVLSATPVVNNNVNSESATNDIATPATSTATTASLSASQPVAHNVDSNKVMSGHYTNVANNTIKLATISPKTHFYVKGKAVKVNPRDSKHATVVKAYRKGNNVVYTVKVGKLVGHVYGHDYTTPSFMSHKHVNVQISKGQAVHVSVKNVKVVSAVRKGGKVVYHVVFKHGKRTVRGVIYATATKRVWVRNSLDNAQNALLKAQNNFKHANTKKARRAARKALRKAEANYKRIVKRASHKSKRNHKHMMKRNHRRA